MSPTTTIMCANHPDLPVASFCRTCGKPLCSTCRRPVGGTGAAIDLAFFTLLLVVDMPAGVARAAAIALAMSWNFLMNYQFTFADASKRPIWLLYVLFCSSCSIGAIVNWSVSMVLIDIIDGFFTAWPAAAAALGILGGTAFNFVCSKFYVFK